MCSLGLFLMILGSLERRCCNIRSPTVLRFLDLFGSLECVVTGQGDYYHGNSASYSPISSGFGHHLMMWNSEPWEEIVIN